MDIIIINNNKDNNADDDDDYFCQEYYIYWERFFFKSVTQAARKRKSEYFQQESNLRPSGESKYSITKLQETRGSLGHKWNEVHVINVHPKRNDRNACDGEF